MQMDEAPWGERWRTTIRAGETAVVVGLWGGGIAASDLVIAAILLAAGLLVGLIAVGSDPARPMVGKTFINLLLIVVFAVSGAVVYWRHSAAQVAQPPKLADRAQSRFQPEPARSSGLTPEQVAAMIRDGISRQPPPKVIIRPTIEREAAPTAPLNLPRSCNLGCKGWYGNAFRQRQLARNPG